VPGDGGGRLAPDATGLNTQKISATNGSTITTDAPSRGVVSLDTWRWRPWAGWWGGREMACWSFAERSRRTA
jgi:hypothetical protein